jgi:hypothetical protein
MQSMIVNDYQSSEVGVTIILIVSGLPKVARPGQLYNSSIILYNSIHRAAPMQQMHYLAPLHDIK